MGMRHRPNCKKDKRRPRVKPGYCSISNCTRPSALTYYDWPLCDICWDYYAGLNGSGALKGILGVREPKTEVGLEGFEEEMFHAD